MECSLMAGFTLMFRTMTDIFVAWMQVGTAQASCRMFR